MTWNDFRIEKYIIVNRTDNVDLSFIPPNQRRRLNDFDKKILYALNFCYAENVQNIILSSRYGEFNRLVKLISQYKEENEVSPNLFSASVHNYPLGAFSMMKNIKIPTVSISAGEKSFEEGLYAALISKYENLLYCFADENCICFNIKKEYQK